VGNAANGDQHQVNKVPSDPDQRVFHQPSDWAQRFACHLPKSLILEENQCKLSMVDGERIRNSKVFGKLDLPCAMSTCTRGLFLVGARSRAISTLSKRHAERDGGKIY